MTEPYLTIAKNTTYEQTIKKSRFICSIARVSSEEEAQQFITSIQAANKKATHNCFRSLNHLNLQRSIMS